MTARPGKLRGWSTRDLMVVAAIGVVFGVALIPLLYASIAMRGALGPVGDVLYTPLFFVPSLMVLYITRRPGAGVLSGFFIGLVQVPFTPFGWGALLGALNAGLCCEVPFLATRYRRFGLPMLLATGTVAVVCNMALFYVPFGYLNLAIPVQLSRSSRASPSAARFWTVCRRSCSPTPWRGPACSRATR
jgi:energy-coupling factor transport system permease protein